MCIMWWKMLFIILIGAVGSQQNQYGPDPWHLTPAAAPDHDTLVPPDLRRSHRPKDPGHEPSVGDWFFKRLLVIILKNGALNTNEDGSKEISIEMKLPSSHWRTLEEYLISEKPLTEEMYRRSVGYLSEAIYRPSFTEKVVQAWSEYVMSYYNWYKVEITWTLTAITIVASIAVMSKYMSRIHVFVLVFIFLYVYEGIISFKEMEKQEYDQFVSAVNRCKWYFWSSSCDVPISDPLAFGKHMHPARIGIRLLSLLITEPLLSISSAVNTISRDITDDLWYPFDKIVHGGLVIFFNVLCILLVIMLVCNVLLNIPFNIGFFAGLVNFGVSSRQTSIFGTATNHTSTDVSNNGDRLTGENLKKLLDITANAVKAPLGGRSNVFTQPEVLAESICLPKPKIPRSQSAGRLCS